MEASRIVELLDEGKNANWSDYAKSAKNKKDSEGIGGAKSDDLMCVTFYFLCKSLCQEDGHNIRSNSLDSFISKESKSAGKPKANPRSNPGSWFTQQYTQFVNNEQNHFKPEWSEIVHRQGPPSSYTYTLNPRYMEVVTQYFGQEPALMNDQQDRLGESETREGSELIKLGEDLLWHPPGMMKEVVQLLRDKSQLIFYGPPGTGKTFVARALAKHLMEGEQPTFLQFHPSCSYEDFFEGYRPVKSENGGMPQFELIPGPLKELAEDARKRPDKDHVLIIDEINRGNLAKIFGELYFLLEYRDEAIRLQYGGASFSLPKNLLIIGTMNTADRSISHIDAALRRRFHFFPLFPNEEPIKGLLERYLRHNGQKVEWIAKVVVLVNEELGRDSSIGHSYFMRKDLDESWAELIWKYSIMPLIKDHFIDQPETIKRCEEMLRIERATSAAKP